MMFCLHSWSLTRAARSGPFKAQLMSLWFKLQLWALCLTASQGGWGHLNK